jgi:hypothetical protein
VKSPAILGKRRTSEAAFPEDFPAGKRRTRARARARHFLLVI